MPFNKANKRKYTKVEHIEKKKSRSHLWVYYCLKIIVYYYLEFKDNIACLAKYINLTLKIF